MYNEIIICSAIWINDGIKYEDQPENIDIGYVVAGRRHIDCYTTLTIFKGNLNEYMKSLNISDEDYRSHQGFITSSNRFVKRKEAWKIAKANNQIRYGLSASSPNDDENILTSENLY